MKKLFAVAALAVSFTACGPGQTDACKKYVACQTAIDATAGASVETGYGANGTCWKSTQAAADACDTACTAAVSSLASQYPDQTACK